MLRNDQSSHTSEQGERLAKKTNSSGHGEPAASRHGDHVDSSGDDEDSDNVLLESGHYENRKKWDEAHQWKPSSDEPSACANKEVSRRHRRSINQTRNVTHQRQASEDDDPDRGEPRVRVRHWVWT